MTDRERMVLEQLRRRDVVDRSVLEAFTRLPREAFVDPDQQPHAYDDAPLPIGHGQTISQPYVVALTVQALELRGHEHVLDVGTGSGYAAAILSLLARDVVTVERIEELARSAAERLARLGLANVHVHHADGSLGWSADAPYDAIAVAANAPAPPRSLLQQLAIGGRMVVPIGTEQHQRLMRITRQATSLFIEQDLGDVRFVPLVGAEGWPEH